MYVYFIAWAWPARSFGSSRTVNSVELGPSGESQTSAERHVVSAIYLVTAAVT